MKSDTYVNFGRGDMDREELARVASDSACWLRRWLAWRHLPRLLMEVEALRIQRDFAAALLRDYGKAAREQAARRN